MCRFIIHKILGCKWRSLHCSMKLTTCQAAFLFSWFSISTNLQAAYPAVSYQFARLTYTCLDTHITHYDILQQPFQPTSKQHFLQQVVHFGDSEEFGKLNLFDHLPSDRLKRRKQQKYLTEPPLKINFSL